MQTDHPGADMNHVNRRNIHYLKLLCGLAVAMLLCVPPARAQSASQGPNAALYQYRGVDRDQRLVEKARQEGKVVWYTSMPLSDATPFAQAFEKKYAIKVELWRASSDKILHRVTTEGRAKHFTVDVIETTADEVESIAREKLLSEFFSPYLADFPPWAIPPHRLWVTDRLNLFVVAYNTNKFKREDIPKHYEGFVDPKWKGQIAVEVDGSSWMATSIKKLGTERGMKLFEKLSEMQPEVRTGGSLLVGLVAAGEVPVSLLNHSSVVESLKQKGAPIDWVPVEPVVGTRLAVGVAKHAPHPHSALLLADFVLSPEGQELIKAMGRVPASMKVKHNLINFPYVLVDQITVLDEREKWEPLWEKLFLKKRTSP